MWSSASTSHLPRAVEALLSPPPCPLPLKPAWAVSARVQSWIPRQPSGVHFMSIPLNAHLNLKKSSQMTHPRDKWPKGSLVSSVEQGGPSGFQEPSRKLGWGNVCGYWSLFFIWTFKKCHQRMSVPVRGLQGSPSLSMLWAEGPGCAVLGLCSPLDAQVCPWTTHSRLSPTSLLAVVLSAEANSKLQLAQVDPPPLPPPFWI